MTENPSVPNNGPDEKQPPEPRPHAEQGPTFAAAEPRVEDLSAEIARAVTKSSGERVTCRRVAGTSYRCNWWAAKDTDGYDNPAMTGQLVTTHVVVRSALLRVTRANGAGLKIEFIPGTAPR